MSIHAEAAVVEYANFPKGRTADDGSYYGSGQRALTLYADQQVARPGKTERDHRSGAR